MSFVCAEIAQVLRAHSSSGPEQLNLENGQLILILSKNASGWWLGELQVSVDCCAAVHSGFYTESLLGTLDNSRGSSSCDFTSL